MAKPSVLYRVYTFTFQQLFTVAYFWDYGAAVDFINGKIPHDYGNSLYLS